MAKIHNFPKGGRRNVRYRAGKAKRSASRRASSAAGRAKKWGEYNETKANAIVLGAGYTAAYATAFGTATIAARGVKRHQARKAAREMQSNPSGSKSSGASKSRSGGGGRSRQHRNRKGQFA
jgi:hypothetical protein